MAKEHWPPMNKFACKLHGYIVYLPHKIIRLHWAQLLLHKISKDFKNLDNVTVVQSSCTNNDPK